MSLEVGAACSTKGRLAVSTQWCLATLAFLPCPLTSCASHSTPSGASVAINGTCLTVTEQRGPVLRQNVPWGPVSPAVLVLAAAVRPRAAL